MRPDTMAKISIAVSTVALAVNATAAYWKAVRIADLEEQRDIYKSRSENWEYTAKEAAGMADGLSADLRKYQKLDGELTVEDRYKKPLMVTYSGGKDSQVLVTLAERAGINFEVVNSHTTADAPETVYFIRDQFKAMEDRGIKCSIVMPRYKDRPISMWTLIPQKLMPPTRLARYCCSVLKENTGRNRFIATGVRWAESSRRKNSRGVMELMHRDKEKRIILMSDNDDKRQLFETCNVKGKMTVNPIIDWSDEDVWNYANSEHLSMNPLYCEGWKRVGCVGCPLATRGGQAARVPALAAVRETLYLCI